jgi:hypothetical protein
MSAQPARPRNRVVIQMMGILNYFARHPSNQSTGASCRAPDHHHSIAETLL